MGGGKRGRGGQGPGGAWHGLLDARLIAVGALVLAAAAVLTLVLASPRTTDQPTQDTGSGASQWVHLASTAPADVLGAATSTPLYQQLRGSAQSQLGQTLARGTLGTPALVHAYRPAPGQYDVYVVPILADGGGKQQVVALLDLAYDAANARVSALSINGPFQPKDAEYGKPFPQISRDQAAAAFAAGHPDGAAAGVEPQLVYFSLDLSRLQDPRNPQQWTGGGQFPDLAVWLFRGADGQDYIVGGDGHVAPASALPLAATPTPR